MKMLFMFPILNFILAVGSENIDSSDVRLDNLVKLFQEEILFRDMIVNDTLDEDFYIDEDFLEGLISLGKGIYDIDEIERGSVAEQLINILKEKGDKGKKKILDSIDRILGEKKKEKRSINDMWDKIKDYFKDLHIELKEKFMKFEEHVKEQYQKVLDKTKTKAENIRNIAKEFLDDSKKMSKEVAEEALEFFREYKEDLGNVFDDIKVKVKDVLK